MSATEPKDEPEPEFETCPEIDEDFFKKMEESGAYMTVDSWEDDDKEIKIEIKEEPKESPDDKRSSFKRSRTDSERSRERDRKERSHDRDRDRRRRTPERPRRARFSPPRARSSRTRSPPARRYAPSRADDRPPRTQSGSKRPSFLDEITAKFPELQNGQQQNLMMNQQPFGLPQQMMHQMMNQNHMNQMVNSNFMPGPGHLAGPPLIQHFNQHGPIPPLMGQPFQQLQPLPNIAPVINNIVPVPVANPMNNPLIAPGTYVPPQPIAPPRATLASVQSRGASTSLLDNVSARRKEEESQAAAKKNLENLPLIDMLKKISETKSRELSGAAKLERVKEAINLLDEPPTNQRQLPFVFNMSNKTVSSVRSDPKIQLRSPLVISDNNPTFVSQAREEDCRDAMLGNPLRNITGELFDFARNLGLDLVAISEKVKAAPDPTVVQELKPQRIPHARPTMQTQANPQMQTPTKQQTQNQAKRVFPADISNHIVDLMAGRSHKSVQTVHKACDVCEARSRKKFASKGAQCEMAVPCSEPKPVVDEPGSFKASLDAAAMKTISETQRQALAKFCQAFNLYPDTFGAPEPVGRLLKPEKRAPPEVLEDLAAYTNPENPNLENQFISFSPLRPSPEIAAFGARHDSLPLSRSPDRSHFTSDSPYGAGISARRSVSRSPIRQLQYDDRSQMARRSQSFSPPSQNSRRSGYGLNDYEGYDRSPPHMSRSRSPQGMRSQSPRTRRMRSPSPRDGYQGRYPFDSSPRRRPIIERLGDKVPSPMVDARPLSFHMDQGSSSHFRDLGAPSHFTETRPYFIPSPRNRRATPDFRESNSYDGARGRDRPRSRSPSPRRRSPGYRQPPTSRRGRF